MQIEQLGKLLREAYDRAPAKHQVVAIHLFGIKYAAEIGSQASAVAEAAGLKDKRYDTEVRKGARLAPYVRITREL